MRGFFITFEGIDRSGKSTQADLLAEGLASTDHQVVHTWQPGGSPICSEIARLIHDRTHFGRMDAFTELMLYIADRSQNVREVILPAIGLGKIVLCDRYTDSTVAYQGYGRGLSLETISSFNQIATKGLVPDLTVFIDISVEEAQRRDLENAADRMEMEKAPFFERVREGYLRIAESDPERVRVLDGCKPVESISEEIRTIVDRALKDMGSGIGGKQ